jgi:hypothetical protein
VFLAGAEELRWTFVADNETQKPIDIHQPKYPISLAEESPE